MGDMGVRATAPKLREAERSDARIPCSVRDTTRREVFRGRGGSLRGGTVLFVRRCYRWQRMVDAVV